MSDLDFNSNQYHVEISDLASDLYDEALEQNDNDHESAMDAILDYILHELVDGRSNRPFKSRASGKNTWIIRYKGGQIMINRDYKICEEAKPCKDL